MTGPSLAVLVTGTTSAYEPRSIRFQASLLSTKPGMELLPDQGFCFAASKRRPILPPCILHGSTHPELYSYTHRSISHRNITPRSFPGSF
jgi:hypothetical protein